MVKTFTRNRPSLAVIVLLICLPIAAILALLGFAGGHIGRYVVNAEVTAIALREIGLSRLEVAATVKVQNVMPIGITVDRIAYNVYFLQNDDWIYLGRAERTEDIVVPGRGTTTIEVSHEVRTLSVATMLLEAIRQMGQVDMMLSGSAKIEFGPLSLGVPFERTRTLSLRPGQDYKILERTVLGRQTRGDVALAGPGWQDDWWYEFPPAHRPNELLRSRRPWAKVDV